MKYNEEERLGSDKPKLGFTAATDPDTLSKTVRSGVPEFLDVITANNTNGIMHVIHGHRSQAVNWEKLFVETGDYYLRVGVVSDNSPMAEITLRFTWSGDPATSTMIMLG